MAHHVALKRSVALSRWVYLETGATCQSYGRNNDRLFISRVHPFSPVVIICYTTAVPLGLSLQIQRYEP